MDECAYCGTSTEGIPAGHLVYDKDGNPVCEECVNDMTERDRVELLGEEYA